MDIFFVLSGFLITGILYDTQDDPRRFSNFYVRRTLRIFPLYWATLTLVLCAGVFMHARLGWSFAAWPLYLGNMLAFLHPAAAGSTFSMMAQGEIARKPMLLDSLQIGHLWSLCVEEQFYLFWPALIFFVRRRRALIWICVGFLVICPLARCLTQSYAPGWMLDEGLLYKFMPIRIDAFAYGGLLALLRRGHPLPSLKRIAEVYLCFGLILAWRLVGNALVGILLHHQPYILPRWESTWGFVLGDSLSLALLILALDPGSLVYRVLNLSAFRWIGRISYGAYVFHYIFIRLNVTFVDSLPLKHKYLPGLVIPLVLTVFLAWLSFRYFETPFIRLKSRFAS